MDVKTITELVKLISDYGMETVIIAFFLLLLLGIVIWFGRFINKLADKFIDSIGPKHSEAMSKVDKAMDTVNGLTKEIKELIKISVRHQADLEHGEKRFQKIEEDVQLIRKNHHDLRNIVTINSLSKRRTDKIPSPRKFDV